MCRSAHGDQQCTRPHRVAAGASQRLSATAPATSPMQKAEPLACSMQALPPPEPKGTLRAVDRAANARPPGTACGSASSLLPSYS